MFLGVLYMLLKAFVSYNIFGYLSLQGRHFLGAHFFKFYFILFYACKSTMLKLQKRGGNRASQREQGRGGGGRETRKCFIFLPSPSLLFFFCPSTYPKGCYFYSPQCSFVRISKTAATIIQT